MKTPQEYLIKIVKLKHDWLKEHGSPDLPDYITDADIRDLEQWPDDVARDVLKKMHGGRITWAVPRMAIYVFHDAYCPWCKRHIKRSDDGIYHGCKNCTYGKRHGVCGDPDATEKDNDWWQIIDFISKQDDHFMESLAALQRQLNSLIQEGYKAICHNEKDADS